MSWPHVLQVLGRWNRQVKLEVIKKVVSDFDVKETVVVEQAFWAILTPMVTQKLLLKPEGQRSWKYWSMWSKTDLKLDWMLRDEQCKEYRVMEKTDWRQAGFFEYELAETASIT